MDIVELIRELDIRVEGINCSSVDTLGQVTHSPENMTYATFVSHMDYLKDLDDRAKVIITTEEIGKEILESLPEVGVAIVEDPTITFFRLHNHLLSNENYGRKRFEKKIGEGCRISPCAHIADSCVAIGDNVVIEENVVIRENVTIGSGSIIRAGAVIGGEGFEFKRDGKRIMGITHGGGVVIGENVEVQYNSCIDKAIYPWDDTIIGDYTKIDDLVYVAHGCKIGEAVLIASNAVVGGRVKIGPNTWIGFGATMRNGIELGSNSRANIGAVVTKNVEDGGAVSGNFAIDHNLFIEKMRNNR